MRREFDLDQLADYAAGLLHGAEAAEVADLVVTDPTWRSAFTALLEADATVRARLHDAAQAAPELMPDDVVARLDQALATAAVASRAQSGTSRVTAAVTSLDTARSMRGSRSAKTGASRRNRRLVGAIATAAAAVAAVVGGLSVLPDMGGSETAAEAPGFRTESDAGAGDPGPAMAPSAPPGGEAPNTTNDARPVLLSSGTDYGQPTVAQLAERIRAAGPSGAPATGDTTRDALSSLRPTAPAALIPLTEPEALAACLAQVRSVHPGAPAVLDYAWYEGQPALLILLRSGQAATVVVVGPDCGGSGPDVVTVVAVP